MSNRSLKLNTASQSEECYFNFRYTVFRVLVEIQKGRLIAKTGMKTIVVPLQHLQYFFYHVPVGQDQMELVLAYQSNNKLKRARLFADIKQDEFHALIDFIRIQCPQGDISHMSALDAYQHMGSKELSWIVIPALMAIAIVLVALCGMPMLLHGLDHGYVEMTAVQIYQNPTKIEDLNTHNMTLRAQADSTHAWRALEQQGQRLLYEMILPLYPINTQLDKPPTTQILLQMRGTGEFPLEQLTQQKLFKGIVRNIGWEGLGNQTRKTLLKNGLKLSPKPILLEYQAKNKDDLKVYILILSTLSTLLLFVVLYLKPSKL
jgi:hypothetical protein